MEHIFNAGTDFVDQHDSEKRVGDEEFIDNSTHRRGRGVLTDLLLETTYPKCPDKFYGDSHCGPGKC
jgi:hypothetical protein